MNLLTGMMNSEELTLQRKGEIYQTYITHMMARNKYETPIIVHRQIHRLTSSAEESTNKKKSTLDYSKR
jgi:hypothetical protein